MSISYDITAKIEAHYSQDIIFSLLKKGSNVGFTYFDFIFGERYEDSPIIDAYTATEKIIYNTDDFPCAYAGFEKTYFHICFRKESAIFLDVSLFIFAYKWEKDFTIIGQSLTDLERYAYLLLKLVDEYKIVSFRMEGS